MRGQLEAQNALIVVLAARCGYVEDQVSGLDRDVDRLRAVPTPMTIDLTSDDETNVDAPELEDLPEVIDLTDEEDEEVIGGPIVLPVAAPVDVWIDDTFDGVLGELVPETPSYVYEEEVRTAVIREEFGMEASNEAELLVRAGLVLPEYERAPSYVAPPEYYESE